MAAAKGNGEVYHVTNIESGNELKWDRIKAFEVHKTKLGRPSKYHPNLFLKRDQATRETHQVNSSANVITELLENLSTESSVDTEGVQATSETSQNSPSDRNKPSVETEEYVKCCFFNTTLNNGDLPTWTPYPLDGDVGTFYNRISVPFKVIWDKYPICWFWCAVKDQVHYICGRKDQENKIEKAILNGYDDKNNEEYNNSGSKKVENKYLKENKKDNKSVKINKESKTINKEVVYIKTKDDKYRKETIIVISKNKTVNILKEIQNDIGTGYEIFYNIAVCGDVPLEKDKFSVDEVKKTIETMLKEKP